MGTVLSLIRMLVRTAWFRSVRIAFRVCRIPIYVVAFMHVAEKHSLHPPLWLLLAGVVLALLELGHRFLTLMELVETLQEHIEDWRDPEKRDFLVKVYVFCILLIVQGGAMAWVLSL